jgi:hypothetical protein
MTKSPFRCLTATFSLRRRLWTGQKENSRKRKLTNSNSYAPFLYLADTTVLQRKSDYLICGLVDRTDSISPAFGEKEGLLKLVIDPRNGKVIGLHVLSL